MDIAAPIQKSGIKPARCRLSVDLSHKGSADPAPHGYPQSNAQDKPMRGVNTVGSASGRRYSLCNRLQSEADDGTEWRNRRSLSIRKSMQLAFDSNTGCPLSSLSTRMSMYSCHGSVAESATVYESCMTSLCGISCDSNVMPTRPTGASLDRRRSGSGLDRLSHMAQLITCGKPLGEAVSELRCITQAWSHCSSSSVRV